MIVPTFSEPPSSPPHCDLFLYPDPAAQPDTNFAAEPTASWTTRADKDVMLQLYSDFCLSVRRESEVCESKLRVYHPLRTWVEGNAALLGDACHPTLPVHLESLSSGLRILANSIWGASQAKTAQSYLLSSRLRKSRTEFLVTKAAASGLVLHLSDPAAQAERDEAFRQVRFIRTYTYTSPLSFLPYPFSTLPYPRSHRNTQVAHGGPNPDKRLQIYVTRHIIALDKQHTNTPLA
ncbi:hypothetical protein K438DRAFT_1966218 [Mycena galopus ATCC 62051]|nr:hypothetical protein K438DRAFT_1966218 [Mycena galopus ATCC 62051]